MNIEAKARIDVIGPGVDIRRRRWTWRLRIYIAVRLQRLVWRLKDTNDSWMIEFDDGHGNARCTIAAGTYSRALSCAKTLRGKITGHSVLKLDHWSPAQPVECGR